MSDPTDVRLQHISLSLREHNIGLILPAGGRIEGKMVLPHGALLAGEFVGDLMCESGSVIIPAGARFRGTVEAERIYIEGDVSSLTEASRRSILIGRQMIAASSTARVNADLYSRTFALHKAKVWGGLYALEDLEQRNARAPAIRHSASTAAGSSVAAPRAAAAAASTRASANPQPAATGKASASSSVSTHPGALRQRSA